MSFKRILYYTILGIGLSAIASYGVGILDYLLSFIGLHMSTPDFTMRYDVFNNILLVIATCIAAPIFEELLFRGLILKSLKRFGNMFAIIITSLLFGLAHGNLPQSIPTFFMSLVLCYVVLRSDSLLPAIAIHFINNLIGMIQLYLQDVAYMQLVYLAFDLLIILITSVVLYKKRVQIKTYIQTHKGAPLLSYFTRLAPIAYLSFSLLMIIATLFIKL